VLIAVGISGLKGYARKSRNRTARRGAARRRAAPHRTNEQNQITERGLFASHPRTASRNIQTIPPIQIRVIRGPSLSPHRPARAHSPLGSCLYPSFSALAIWKRAGHDNQHEPRQKRTPHTDIHGFYLGLLVRRCTQTTARTPAGFAPLPVTRTPMTLVETHFKAGGYVVKLIRLLSDFANRGRG